MIGRRSAALLCVLLAHALLIYYLTRELGGARRGPDVAWDAVTFDMVLIEDEPALEPGVVIGEGLAPAPSVQLAEPGVPATDPGEAAGSTAITDTSGVDWPLEGKKAAARVLAREAEAERIAKMFAGPGGTWASLTKRQRSKLNKFRFKAGVDGLEYDEKGNQIYHISDGCMIVNSGFIACKVGKVKARGNMFENMREYFDELRLPETDEGNGTEPEALKPPY